MIVMFAKIGLNILKMLDKSYIMSYYAFARKLINKLAAVFS